MRAFKALLLGTTLLLAAFVSAAAVAPPAPAGQVQSFSINTSLIFELYNVAQQNNGNVSSYPAGMNPAVVQATVKNIGSSDAQLCFQIVVQEDGKTCADSGGASLVWSPVITTKDAIKAGETRSLGASDFTTQAGGYQGNLCNSFEDDLKNDFQDVDPSKLGSVVDKLLKRKFKVCLVPVDCAAGSNDPSVADQRAQCSSFTLFQPNPGAQAQVGVLIYPHNNAVPNCNLNFLWTPALYPGLSASEVKYVLEVLEDQGGEPYARVQIPAGQTFYQWSPRDPQLKAGTKYYWRVISLKAKTGAPFGGPDGRGWNIMKWFTCGADQAAEQCHFNLADLDRYVQQNAKPEVRDALKGFIIKALAGGDLKDPAICHLINGQATLTGITVTKN